MNKLGLFIFLFFVNTITTHSQIQQLNNLNTINMPSSPKLINLIDFLIVCYVISVVMLFWFLISNRLISFSTGTEIVMIASSGIIVLLLINYCLYGQRTWSVNAKNYFI
jgi:hypothetical protein